MSYPGLRLRGHCGHSRGEDLEGLANRPKGLDKTPDLCYYIVVVAGIGKGICILGANRVRPDKLRWRLRAQVVRRPGKTPDANLDANSQLRMAA